MKIRLFLDDTDRLVIANENPIKQIERCKDKQPYTLVEVEGELTDVSIMTPTGYTLHPTKAIHKDDYVMIVEWSESLL